MALSSTFLNENGTIYVFDQNGYYSLAKNGWYQDKDYSLYYFNDDSVIRSKWKKSMILGITSMNLEECIKIQKITLKIGNMYLM